MVTAGVMTTTVKWNARAKAGFVILAVLPNILGMINIPVAEGFRLHFFQLAIFLAAALYGPAGGVMSGFAGSFYAAFVTGNPYLILGNAILGLCSGLFIKKGLNIVVSVWLAFIIQLPWLILTDYFLVGLDAPVIRSLVVSLFLTNTVWALAASLLRGPAERYIS